MSQEKNDPKTLENKAKNVESEVILDGNAVAIIIGKDSRIPAERGWAVRGLNSVEDFYLPDRRHVLDFLIDFSKQTGIKTFKIPIAFPRHNGKLNTTEDFTEIYELSENGEKDGYKITVMKGSNYEGCVVNPGEAFVMAPADCLTVVSRNEEGKTIAMHAGRDSIFDIENEDRPTLGQSIAEAYKGSDLKKVKIWIGFGILPGQHFDHPEDPANMPNKFTTEEKVEIAKLNEERRMYLIKRYGESCYVKSKNKNGEDVYYIDLYQTMKNILTRIGFEEENIILDKNVNTSDGNFPAYTNRGGDSGRNFVIVTPVA